MPKGNKKARGTIGNKGGSGRPTKPENEKLTKPLNLRITQALWEKIQVATMLDCSDNWRDFLREFLNKNLRDNGELR